jgi:hypothetical protein
METETLHFKVGLCGTSQLKQPEFRLMVNEVEMYRGSLSNIPHEIEYFEFDISIEEGNNFFGIEFLNKLSEDTIKDESNNIVNDMILSIKSLEIDDISMDTLLWSNSLYYPIYPENYLNEQQKSITEIRNCVDLGWNGTWKFPFTSPFYIWLLETI